MAWPSSAGPTSASSWWHEYVSIWHHDCGRRHVLQLAVIGVAAVHGSDTPWVFHASRATLEGVVSAHNRNEGDTEAEDADASQESTVERLKAIERPLPSSG